MPREGKAKVLTEAELKRVIRVAAGGSSPLRDEALLTLSFGLGLRVKELASLDIQDVLASSGHLREEVRLKKHQTKGGTPRHCYLTNPKVKKALLAYLEDRRDREGMCFNREAPLFKSSRGLRFSPNSLQQVFHRLYRVAGLEGASSHSGRRTFATRLIERGVDIKAVSSLMGHASIAMTAHYVQDNPERLKLISEHAL